MSTELPLNHPWLIAVWPGMGHVAISAGYYLMAKLEMELGKYRFCQRLAELGKKWGVQRVFTFAAMATQMNPSDPARVFCAATSKEVLEAICNSRGEALEEGRIGGLNGVLLAAAAEAGLEGACLLGEMPHIFAQLPFPKASLTVLRAFSKNWPSSTQPAKKNPIRSTGSLLKKSGSALPTRSGSSSYSSKPSRTALKPTN